MLNKKPKKSSKSKDSKSKSQASKLPIHLQNSRLLQLDNGVKNAPKINQGKQIFEVTDKASKADGASRVADGFDNFLSRIGLNNDNALSGGTYDFNLITTNRLLLEAAYRGSWVIGVGVDSIADDMTRAGIQLTSNDAADKIGDMKAMMSRLQIFQSVGNGIRWGRLYGGAIAVMDIKGQDKSTPLDPETISEGQFQGIVIYDRWQINPALFDTIDSGPEMGLPKFYSIVTNNTPTGSTPDANASGQIKVHHSRVIRFGGVPLPYFQAITNMMWEESVCERIWDRLISFDNATMSSASLVDRANLRTIGIEGLREIMAAGGKAQQGLERQFDMMRMLQVNEGLTLIDKEDTFASTAYSFAGLSDMMLQFGQQIAGGFGIPLVRFFGQSPAGLNSTGEGDLRMYYDNINAQQEAKLRNPFEKIVKILYRSMYAESAPKDMQFTFTPLWQTTPMDKATIAKLNTDTITEAHDSGLVDTPTAMKELRQSSGDSGIFSNITDEQINEAETEEPPMPEDQPGIEPEKTNNSKPLTPYQKIKQWLSQ